MCTYRDKLMERRDKADKEINIIEIISLLDKSGIEIKALSEEIFYINVQIKTYLPFANEYLEQTKENLESYFNNFESYFNKTMHHLSLSKIDLNCFMLGCNHFSFIKSYIPDLIQGLRFKRSLKDHEDLERICTNIINRTYSFLDYIAMSKKELEVIRHNLKCECFSE